MAIQRVIEFETMSDEATARVSEALARAFAAVASETLALRDNARRARLATIEGQPGIVVLSDHGVQAALDFHIAEGRIAHYDVIADPGRLALLRIEE